MNPNANYLGIVTLLHNLQEQGLVGKSEAKKITTRLMVQLETNFIIPDNIMLTVNFQKGAN